MRSMVRGLQLGAVASGAPHPPLRGSLLPLAQGTRSTAAFSPFPFFGLRRSPQPDRPLDELDTP
jgi:hypothetical protein